jgi:hypothetical protein
VHHITDKKLNLEFAFRFRRWLIVRHYALSTHEAYCRIVLSLCRFLGNKAMRDLTPLIIGDFPTQTLPSGWSDDHISYQLCALRCFFDFLYLGGLWTALRRDSCGRVPACGSCPKRSRNPK